MKVTLSWLNDFAPFGTDAEAIAAALTRLGMQVEEIIPVNEPVAGVIVARVIERAKHPNADRVGLVFVDVGDGQSLQICCGAFNMQPGDLVPLASIGTTMPDGRSIQRSEMRGEWSNGMLCSRSELGLGDDHSGIWILPPGLELGSSPWAGAGLTHDVVFDIDLTRNRPECWGVVGIARDLAASLGLPFEIPGEDVPPSGPPRSASVEIVDGDRCGRFVSAVITGITVGPGAGWMQQRLSLAGMRPINNVVDVSNYVMLELNEPNHAYDLATLGGGGFRIRLATAGEQLTTLDGTVRTMTEDDLLICDAADQPIGLAGVMGGQNTEIAATTTAVALEMAWFESSGIARAAVRHELRSEASVRFDRGRDPYGIDHAVHRFVELLRETCPNAEIAPGLIDGRGTLPEPLAVYLRTSRVNALLATELTDHDIVNLLSPIGFRPLAIEHGLTIDRQPLHDAVGADPGTQHHPDGTEYIVPTWRPDCTREIDLVEEVARHYGYDNIGQEMPKSSLPGGLSPRQRDRRSVRQLLLGLGLSEALPNPWLAPGDAERAGLAEVGQPIVIANPMAAEESVLRISLLPGLLRTVAYNETHRNPGVKFFEIGHVFRHPDKEQALPEESEHLSIVLAGQEAPAAVEVWHALVATLGVKGARLQSSVHPGLHPGRSATVFAAGRPIGVVGEVHPTGRESYGVAERVAYLQVDLGRLLDLPHGSAGYKKVSKFPSSDLDLAFVVPDKTAADGVAASLRKGAGDLLAGLELFDTYRGPGVPEGSRSLAFRVRLQATDRTLTDPEISQVRQACITLANKNGAALR
jgi:phenylalanyl-tRNA synthetase beta chain